MKDKLIAAFWILFFTPFALGGLVALAKAITLLSSPNPQLSAVVVMGTVGVLFTFIGFGLMFAVFFGRKKLAAAQLLQASRPSEPWLWRQDWAEGRADSLLKSQLASTWIFTVVWNLFSFPVAVLLPQMLRQSPNALIALLFPVIGVGMLVWAVRLTLRRIKFGKTTCQLASVPVVIGRDLRGSIQAHVSQAPVKGIQLKLTCMNRYTTGSGNSRSTTEKILWRSEHTVPAEQVMTGDVGSLIPVQFHIPADAVPATATDSNNGIFWILEADGDIPGVNYRDEFQIPVFRTKDSPSEEAAASTAPFSQLEEIPAQKPEDTRIVVRPSAGGGTEFDFGAARNPKMAFGVTVFCAFWSGIVWFLIYSKAPLLFPILFGFFDVILLMIVLSLWFGTSKVVIENGVVKVKKGLLWTGRTHVIPCSQASGLTMPIQMQSGGHEGTPYYSLQLSRRDGFPQTLASGIANKQEAEWLIAEMGRLIGIDPSKAPKELTPEENLKLAQEKYPRLTAMLVPTLTNVERK